MTVQRATILSPQKHKGVRGENLPVDVNHKALVRQIADSSGYNIYEVEDILLHLVHNLHLNFAKGLTVGIRDLGKFNVRETKHAAHFSKIVNRFLEEKISRRVHFSAAQETKHYVNGKIVPERDEDADSEY